MNTVDNGERNLPAGIQDFEKVRILRGELKGKKLEQLNKAVETFRSNKFTEQDDAARMVRDAEAVLRAVE